jgi:hypothetical protein
MYWRPNCDVEASKELAKNRSPARFLPTPAGSDPGRAGLVRTRNSTCCATYGYERVLRRKLASRASGQVVITSSAVSQPRWAVATPYCR